MTTHGNREITGTYKHEFVVCYGQTADGIGSQFIEATTPFHLLTKGFKGELVITLDESKPKHEKTRRKQRREATARGAASAPAISTRSDTVSNKHLVLDSREAEAKSFPDLPLGNDKMSLHSQIHGIGN